MQRFRLIGWWRPGPAQRPGFERWPTRGVYTTTAIATVAGTAMLWRMPSLALAHGGGTFLLAFALVFALVAIPLLVLEVGAGQRTQRATPRSIRVLDRRSEALGWVSVGLGAVLLMVQVVVAAWAILYAAGGIDALISGAERLPWDANAAQFFTDAVFGDRNLPESTGASWTLVTWSMLGITAAIWAGLGLLTALGPRAYGGVMRLAVALGVGGVLFLSVRYALHVVNGAEGIAHGLDWALAVDLSHLGTLDLWVDAAVQALLAVGVGLGVQTALAAHLPREADTANTARVIGLVSGTLVLLLHLVLACMLGMLALSESRQVADVGSPDPTGTADGVAVLLSVLPDALSRTAEGDPAALRAITSIAWFVPVAAFALAAALTLLHGVVRAIRERGAPDRWRLALVVATVGFALTTLIVGWRDPRWVHDVLNGMTPAVLGVALASVIVLGWRVRNPPLRDTINRTSELPLGVSWELSIRLIAPLTLSVLLAHAILRLVP